MVKDPASAPETEKQGPGVVLPKSCRLSGQVRESSSRSAGLVQRV